MAQVPVVSYALQLSTNPQLPGEPFRVGVAIQLQPNGPFTPLLINAPDEFNAVAALIQAPGRLMFDPVGSTLVKIQP